MKKLLLITVFLSVCMMSFAQETKEQQKKVSKRENKTLVYPEKFSHWSLAIGGGANLIIGDLDDYRKLSPIGFVEKCADWSAKFQVEYMINPVWGIRLEYLYSAQNKNSINYVIDVFDGNPDMKQSKDIQMHDISAQFVFDVLNIVRRTRTYTNWNFFMGFGGGILRFQKIKDDGSLQFRNALSIPLTMSVEYSPIPELGIFADAQARWYSKDDVNAQEGGVMKDMSAYMGLGLKYHIITKDKPHVYNVDMNTYEPLTAMVDKQYVNKMEKMQSKLDSLEQEVGKANAGVADLKKGQDDAIRAIDSLADQKINNIVGAIAPTTNNYITNETKAGDTNITNNILYQFNSDDNGIYFEFDSDKIESEYYKEVLKIARRMLDNHKLKVKIIGYCDEKGSVEYNKKLAQRRINAVIYILVNRFRIEKERFTSENVGRITGENEISELNRRVDVEYYY